MAAFFIRKSDNLHYLRLTGNTTTVKFAAVKEAALSYVFNILRPVEVGGTISITSNIAARGYTSSAVPIPISPNPLFPFQLNNGAFGNVETSFVFEFGPTTRDYQVRGFSNTIQDTTAAPNLEHTYNDVELRNLILGGETVSVNNVPSISYPGFKKFTGLFVKQSGTWKSPPTTHVNQSGAWKVPQISIKHNGAWERVFPPNAYSNWINMLDNSDDALDFAVQVHAIN